MRFHIGLALAGAVSLTVTAAVTAQQPRDIPEWAYNSTPTPAAQVPHHPAIDPKALLTIPGSARRFTLEEIENGADWFPGDHPPMPDIVSKGREGVRPCGTCHMPNGKGRPSNGPVTALPVAYFIQAVEDYKNGVRVSADPKKTNIQQMIGFAKLLTPEEVKTAAEYFGAMKWTKWIRVVESERVPKTYVEGFIHYRYPGNETEPLGMRIIEMPEDNHQTEPLRNPRSGFVAYAPPGSIRRGEDLVKTGGNGRTVQCGICHGADLRGLGNVPGIAGKSPTWLARQMFDMQAGTRRGPGSVLMKQAVENLRNEDYVALAAYIASLDPEAPPQGGGSEDIQAPASFTAPAIPGVVAAGTRIELVAAGLPRTEGPLGMPDGSMLVSSTNSILKVDASGTVTTFIENSNQTNGMGWDGQGRLISVQRGKGNEKVGVLYPADKVTTLADNVDGRPFDALNDMALDRRGGVYFTDTQGIYYLPPGGKAVRIIDEVPRPNGVLLSPDEKTLYVHNKDGVYMLAFDVAADGSISNRRNFARYKSVRVPGHKDPSWDEDNGADGMAVDSDGRIYAATNAGVEVFSPRGELLGVLPVQWGAEANAIRKPQNVAFGGPDRRTLYIVGSGTIYKVRTLSRGPDRPTK